jgi:hypothetical protein
LAAEVVACFPLPQSVTAFSVLAVCVAASHVSDIFAVAAGLRLVIRRGLIAMVFFDGRNRRQRDLRRHRFRERSLPPVLVIVRRPAMLDSVERRRAAMRQMRKWQIMRRSGVSFFHLSCCFLRLRSGRRVPRGLEEYGFACGGRASQSRRTAFEACCVGRSDAGRCTGSLACAGASGEAFTMPGGKPRLMSRETEQQS